MYGYLSDYLILGIFTCMLMILYYHFVLLPLNIDNKEKHSLNSSYENAQFLSKYYKCFVFYTSTRIIYLSKNTNTCRERSLIKGQRIRLNTVEHPEDISDTVLREERGSAGKDGPSQNQ